MGRKKGKGGKKYIALSIAILLLVAFAITSYAVETRDDYTFKGPVTMSGTNTLSGATTISGALTQSGAVTFSSTLTANGNVDIGNAASDTLTITSIIDGNVTLDDGVTNSPSLIWKDASDETVNCLKADSGYLQCTTLAADGVQVVTGNLKVGGGTPGATINGEDFYVTGVSEFDGTSQFDGSLTIGDAVTDGLTITAAIQGASPIVLDGATDNTNETTIAVTDPTADNTITIRDGSGYMGVFGTPIAKTTSVSIALKESVSTITNAGSGASITLTLPEASTVLGIPFTFCVAEAQSLIIDVDAADQIVPGTNAAGDSYWADAIGECVVLEAITDTYFAEKGSASGTWTDGN